MSTTLLYIIMLICLAAPVCLWVVRGDWPKRTKRRKRPLPPPDVIGRPPTCANGVEGCGIKRPHSHTRDFIRRVEGK